jgi:hypothetical protein
MVGAFKIDPVAAPGRETLRHHLRLSADIVAGASEARVLIHNLSATGLLIEVPLDLEVGDEFEVELPRSMTAQAQIVWRNNDYFGCEFKTPLSAASVSAARLRSLPQGSSQVAAPLPGHAASPAAPAILSPSGKALVIGALAAACWIPVVLAILYLAA